MIAEAAAATIQVLEHARPKRKNTHLHVNIERSKVYLTTALLEADQHRRQEIARQELAKEDRRRGRRQEKERRARRSSRRGRLRKPGARRSGPRRSGARHRRPSSGKPTHAAPAPSAATSVPSQRGYGASTATSLASVPTATAARVAGGCWTSTSAKSGGRAKRHSRTPPRRPRPAPLFNTPCTLTNYVWPGIGGTPGRRGEGEEGWLREGQAE